jgi:hypothetical protein
MVVSVWLISVILLSLVVSFILCIFARILRSPGMYIASGIMFLVPVGLFGYVAAKSCGVDSVYFYLSSMGAVCWFVVSFCCFGIYFRDRRTAQAVHTAQSTD